MVYEILVRNRIFTKLCWPNSPEATILHLMQCASDHFKLNYTLFIVLWVALPERLTMRHPYLNS